MRKSALWVAAFGMAAMLALWVGGCGSSDPELTKAEFVKQGDEICKENYAERERVLLKYVKEIQASGKLPSKTDEKQVLLGTVVPLFREQSEDLADLGVPTTQTAEAEAIVEGIEEAIEKVEEEPEKALEGTSAQFGPVEKKAQEYGFEYCGRS